MNSLSTINLEEKSASLSNLSDTPEIRVKQETANNELVNEKSNVGKTSSSLSPRNPKVTLLPWYLPETRYRPRQLTVLHVQATHDVPASASVVYHIRTLWLTTRSDLKSIVIPETAFGIFSALSGPILTTNQSPRFLTILGRLPMVILWNWINVVVFDLANQRLPSSVLEDSVNKPWRPLPSGRINAVQARRLLLGVLPVVFLITLYIGGMEETVAMMVLTWMYNDLGGADENYVVRNLINCFGFMCYSSGATLVACGFGQYTLNSQAYPWLAMVGGIVLTTLQMQDMSDQEGDRTRGRGTIPLVLGDGVARWTIAVPVTIWSLACPIFWEIHPYAFIAPLVLGGAVGLRILLLRSVDADKVTWKFWNLWISCLYLLPLIKYHTAWVSGGEDVAGTATGSASDRNECMTFWGFKEKRFCNLTLVIGGLDNKVNGVRSEVVIFPQLDYCG